MKPRSSVAVIGAGVAGLAAANVLAAQGYQVHVIDVGQAPKAPKGEALQARVSAFSPASISLLQELGVWADVMRRAQPYRRMAIWVDGEFDRLDFSADELGEPALGAIAENATLQFYLYQQAQNQGVEFVFSADWQLLQTEPKPVLQLLGESRTFDWLVGADGAQSRLRQQLGIRQRGWRYQQSAIVCEVEWQNGNHGDTAWQRFLPTGPLALLPLPNGNSSLVWSLESSEFKQRLDCAETEFIASLEAALAPVFAYRIASVGRRFHFPLSLGQSERYWQGRCILLGDAAHRVHPLAGQGLNLGLMDVKDLKAALAQAPLSPSVLDQWQRRRQAKAFEMMALTDSLYRLFRLGYAADNNTGTARFASGALRTLIGGGFALLASQPVLRQQLARLAIRGD